GEVCNMSREGPGWFPPGAAVPAEVERQDATPAPALLRKPLEHARVTGHPVQADERSTLRIAPFVDVQLHRPTLLGRGKVGSATGLLGAASGPPFPRPPERRGSTCSGHSSTSDPANWRGLAARAPPSR